MRDEAIAFDASSNMARATIMRDLMRRAEGIAVTFQNPNVPPMVFQLDAPYDFESQHLFDHGRPML